MLRINMLKGRYYVWVCIGCYGKTTKVRMLVDTGAAASSVPRGVLEQLPDAEMAQETVHRGGIVPGATRSYSKYLFDVFIDTLVLQDTPLLIPKDDGNFMPLLGIDILSKLDFVQHGNTCQINIRAPQYDKIEDVITSNNVNYHLEDILKSLHREDLYVTIAQSLPSSIEMSYDDFRLSILGIIRHMHMT